MKESVTDKMVKFAFGTKANYSSATHSDYVYFASDAPLIHAKGMWRGVSKVALSGNNLKITVGSKDDSDNPAIVLSADLSSIATTADQRKNWDTAYNFVNGIMGSDNGVIDKWQEVVDFLAGIEGTTLQAIMKTKANAATKVFGGDGITVQEVDGNGSNPTTNPPTLGKPFRIMINNQLLNATYTQYYTKFKANEVGLITGVSTLAASDIPTLAISKISGLQAALDDKLPKSNEIVTAFPLSGGGPLNDEPTISLLYDNSTLVVDSTSHKLKVGTIAQSQVSGLSTTLAGYVPTSRTISAGNGLTGGGDLTANRTLSVKAADASVNVSSSGVKVVSAPKLTNAQTLWGNSFDGTASISGDIKFYNVLPTAYTGRGMRLTGADSFIGFSNITGNVAAGVKAFAGITLGWGATPEADTDSVRIADDTFTYKGKPIYYKGLAQFTTDVNSLISTALKPMATDFTALTNRVTVVENQLKWIEVTN